MLVEAKCPVILPDAELPRHSKRYDVYYLSDTTLEIPERSHSKLQYALKVSEKEYMRQKCKPVLNVVYERGRFFKNSGVHISTFKSNCVDPVYSIEQFRSFAYNQLIAPARTPSLDLLPRTIPFTVIGASSGLYSPPEKVRQFYRQYASKMTLSNDYLERISVAEESFQSLSESLFLCDGYIWQEISEPYFSVSQRHDVGRLNCHADRLPYRSPITLEKRLSNDYVLFSVGQYDDAVQHAISKFDHNSPWPARDFKAEILMPEVFSDEMPLGDPIGQLQNYCFGMGKTNRATEPLLQFLSDETQWTFANIIERFAEILEDWSDFKNEFFSSIPFEFERLQSRPIHLDLSVSDFRI